MQFRTKIPIFTSKNPIIYNSKIVSLGSCFAVTMAEKLNYFKFQNTCNPFGIIFNCISIEKIIHKAVNQELFTEKDIFFHNERWHCFDVHSDLSHTVKEELITNLNLTIHTTQQQLKEASHIIITYGTSWVYRHLESNTIVANCHKVPQKEFSKEILSLETIEKSIQNTLNLIQKINPNVSFIFTVSPVRHLKDGFIENQVSKANLIGAIYCQLKTSNFKLITEYFPSYEIMMDELRDYRFYAEDMIHPSQVAMDYIWQRFSQTTVSEESQSMMNEVETIQKGLAHRSFSPDTEIHKKFLDKLNQKINTFAVKFPHIQF